MTPQQRDRLKNILAAAYRQKEADAVPDGWQMGVMRRIRLLPASARRTVALEDAAGLAWRFAAAACVLVAVLSAVALQDSFQTEYEMARMFIGAPLDFSLVQSMGIF